MENIRESLINAKRIVFKFGTNVLRNDDKEISLSRIYTFIEDISKLKNKEKKLLLLPRVLLGSVQKG